MSERISITYGALRHMERFSKRWIGLAIVKSECEWDAKLFTKK